jgi:hypothetical protein
LDKKVSDFSEVYFTVSTNVFFSFLKALLFVMMDLTGEVSSGAVDMAKSNLEKMLVNIFKINFWSSIGTCLKLFFEEKMLAGERLEVPNTSWDNYLIIIYLTL